MNKENASKLWKIIQEAGDYLLVLRNSPAQSSSHKLCEPFKIHKNKPHKDSLKTTLKLVINW